MALAHDGIDASWMSADAKAALHRATDQEAATLRLELTPGAH